MTENGEDASQFIPTEHNLPSLEIVHVETPTTSVWYASSPKNPEADNPTPINEDTILVNTKTGLLVIADGMTTHGDGKVASTQAANGVDLLVSGRKNSLDIPVDRLISPPNRDSDTTLTALLFHPEHNTAEILHVGDSRLYAILKTNPDRYELQQLTPDISIAYSDHPVFEPWASYLLSSLTPYTQELDQQYATALAAITQTVNEYRNGASTLEDVIRSMNPDQNTRWIDPELTQQELTRKRLPEYPLPYQDCWLSKNRSAGFYADRRYLHHHSFPVDTAAVAFLAVTDGISDVISHESLRQLVQTELLTSDASEQQGENIVRTLMDTAGEMRKTTKNDDQTVAIAFVKR